MQIPVTSGIFSFDGESLFVETAGGNLHRRATLLELREHFDPPVSDSPAHWYEAQLLHYGLPTSRVKGTAKMRLYNAVTRGGFRVPGHIQAIDAELGRRWEGLNGVSCKRPLPLKRGKARARLGNAPAKSGEGNTDSISREGSSVSVVNNFNIRPLGAAMQAPSPTLWSTYPGGPMISPTIPGNSGLSGTRPAIQPQPWPRVPERTDPCLSAAHDRTPDMDSAYQSESLSPDSSSLQKSFPSFAGIKAEDLDNDEQCFGGLGDSQGDYGMTYGEEARGEGRNRAYGYDAAYVGVGMGYTGNEGGHRPLQRLGLINGRYELQSKWNGAGGTTGTLILTLDGQSVWGCFKTGELEGMFLLRDRPYSPYEGNQRVECRCSLRGELGGFTVYDGVGHPASCQHVNFLGGGLVRGMVRYGQAFGDYISFAGVRVSGDDTRSEIGPWEMRLRWEEMASAHM